MKWWGWVILAIILYWAIKHSTQAAADVHGIGNFFSSVFGS